MRLLRLFVYLAAWFCDDCLVLVCFSSWKFVTQVQLECSIKERIDLYQARSFCVFNFFHTILWNYRNYHVNPAKQWIFLIYNKCVRVLLRESTQNRGKLQPLSVNSFNFAVVDFLSIDDEKLFLLSLINFNSLLYKWKSFFYFYTENFLCKSKSTYILS